MDAAVAACAVQCVVEPESTGIGGDCFCLYSQTGTGDIVAYNGSGRAPAAATADWYLANGINEIERQTPHSVTVPGAIDAWDRLIADHGRLSLAEILQPAIGYARDGYPVSSRVSVDFASQAEFLAKDKNAASVFMPGGRTPACGDMHQQPALAQTLEKIASQGRDGFYRGDVADDIVSYLQSLGGLHTADDFANAAGEYVTPISTTFRDSTVYQCPPNGQGIIALMLLNMFEDMDPSRYEHELVSVERLHLEIEAGRLAYQDRNYFVADPAQADVPIEFMLSQARARELTSLIDPARRLENLPVPTAPAHESTVYISVVDSERNSCSFINTLFNNFGSVQMAPRSGVMLHNRGQGFVVDPEHPNCIAPGKRPLHTIIPGMVTNDDRVSLCYGVMGGHYQAFGHMQFLTALFDYGLDIQQAQDRPRFFPFGDEVEVEGTIPDSVRTGLIKLGHRLTNPAKPIGGSQAIRIDWQQNVLTAGSDPRKDGCAIGY